MKYWCLIPLKPLVFRVLRRFVFWGYLFGGTHNIMLVHTYVFRFSFFVAGRYVPLLFDVTHTWQLKHCVTWSKYATYMLQNVKRSMKMVFWKDWKAFVKLTKGFKLHLYHESRRWPVCTFLMCCFFMNTNWWEIIQKLNAKIECFWIS